MKKNDLKKEIKILNNTLNEIQIKNEEEKKIQQNLINELQKIIEKNENDFQKK